MIRKNLQRNPFSVMFQACVIQIRKDSILGAFMWIMWNFPKKLLESLWTVGSEINNFHFVWKSTMIHKEKRWNILYIPFDIHESFLKTFNRDWFHRIKHKKNDIFILIRKATIAQPYTEVSVVISAKSLWSILSK